MTRPLNRAAVNSFLGGSEVRTKKLNRRALMLTTRGLLGVVRRAVRLLDLEPAGGLSLGAKRGEGEIKGGIEPPIHNPPVQPTNY